MIWYEICWRAYDTQFAYQYHEYCFYLAYYLYALSWDRVWIVEKENNNHAVISQDRCNEKLHFKKGRLLFVIKSLWPRGFSRQLRNHFLKTISNKWHYFLTLCTFLMFGTTYWKQINLSVRNGGYMSTPLGFHEIMKGNPNSSSCPVTLKAGLKQSTWTFTL